MQIPASQVVYKRKIGEVDGDDVIEIATKGGLHLAVRKGATKVEVLGTGPHRSVSRHLAKKKAPRLVITDLAKGDHWPIETFSHLIPKYEVVTDRIATSDTIVAIISEVLA